MHRALTRIFRHCHESILRLGPRRFQSTVNGCKTENTVQTNPYRVVFLPSSSSASERVTPCILLPSTHSFINNFHGFYTPPPPLDPTDLVSLKHTPNMGLGVFAKQNFKPNQVIFSERPLLIYPSELGRTPPGLSKQEKQKQHHSFLEKFKLVEGMMGGMPKAYVEAYMSLFNCIPNWELPPLVGIGVTNAYRLDFDKEVAAGYAVVGNLVSRINHSCMRNVYQRFDIPTFSLQIVAWRHIEAGQQLFTSYCWEYSPSKDRQRFLASFRFECQCKACLNATPRSDKLREEMLDRIETVTDPKVQRFLSLEELLELEEEIVEEGLDTGAHFARLLDTILYVYKCLDDVPKQWEYRTKWETVTGENHRYCEL